MPPVKALSPPTPPVDPQCRFVVETKAGVLVVTRQGATLSRRDQLALKAPLGPAQPWRLEDGATLTQVVDPLLELAMVKLRGRRVFRRAFGEEVDIVGHESLTIRDGVFIWIDGYKEKGERLSCRAGIIAHDPTFLPAEHRHKPTSLTISRKAAPRLKFSPAQTLTHRHGRGQPTSAR